MSNNCEGQCALPCISQNNLASKITHHDPDSVTAADQRVRSIIVSSLEDRNGTDPHDYVIKHGIGAYQRAVAELAQPWLRWMVNYEKAARDLNHPIDCAAAYSETMSLVHKIRKPTTREKCAVIARRELLKAGNNVDTRGNSSGVDSTRDVGSVADHHPALDRAPAFVTTVRLHVIYGTMLAHGLRLDERDYNALMRRPGWSEDRIFGTRWFQHPEREEMNLRAADVKSAPTTWLALLSLVQWLAGIFDLSGVPGFYREDHLSQPSSADDDAAWQLFETKKLFGPWRVKLHDKFGRPYRSAVVAPYERAGMIVGVKVIPIQAADKPLRGFVLTSRGLPGGSQAVAA